MKKHPIPAGDEPVPAEYLKALDDLDRLASKLDIQFRVPLTAVRLGWDPIIGIVPIAGDLAALAVSLRIVSIARNLGASPKTVRRMLYNSGVDAVVGLIPVAGFVFDIYFKANIQNVDLLMGEIRTCRSDPSR